jgi:hypothetical protein
LKNKFRFLVGFALVLFGILSEHILERHGGQCLIDHVQDNTFAKLFDDRREDVKYFAPVILIERDRCVSCKLKIFIYIIAYYRFIFISCVGGVA